MTYLGWYDPDKKKPAQKKLEDAIARYRELYVFDADGRWVGRRSEAAA